MVPILSPDNIKVPNFDRLVILLRSFSGTSFDSNSLLEPKSHPKKLPFSSPHMIKLSFACTILVIGQEAVFLSIPETALFYKSILKALNSLDDAVNTIGVSFLLINKISLKGYSCSSCTSIEVPDVMCKI